MKDERDPSAQQLASSTAAHHMQLRLQIDWQGLAGFGRVWQGASVSERAGGVGERSAPHAESDAGVLLAGLLLCLLVCLLAWLAAGSGPTFG